MLAPIVLLLAYRPGLLNGLQPVDSVDELSQFVSSSEKIATMFNATCQIRSAFCYPVGTTMSTNCPNSLVARKTFPQHLMQPAKSVQRSATQLGQLGDYVDELSPNSLGAAEKLTLTSGIATYSPRVRSTSRYPVGTNYVDELSPNSLGAAENI